MNEQNSTYSKCIQSSLVQGYLIVNVFSLCNTSLRMPMSVMVIVIGIDILGIVFLKNHDLGRVGEPYSMFYKKEAKPSPVLLLFLFGPYP